MRPHLSAVLTPLLGVITWIVLFLLPLQIEWAAQDTQPAVVALDLLPLLLLLVGLLVRHPALLLFAFPASLIPPFLLLPELDRAVFNAPGSFLWLVVALSGYTAAAAAWLARRPQQRQPRDPLPVPLTDDAPSPLADGAGTPSTRGEAPNLYRNLWWPYQLHFMPRLVILTIILVALLYTANFAEAIVSMYPVHFGDQAIHAQIMANLLLLFLWIVVAYLFFISPGLNLELEQRELDNQIARLDGALRTARPRPWLIAVAALAAFAAMVALVALRLA